jgi:hypothetical protein
MAAKHVQGDETNKGPEIWCQSGQLKRKGRREREKEHFNRNEERTH